METGAFRRYAFTFSLPKEGVRADIYDKVFLTP